jgi:nucleoside recognition membrane protein YjiH
MFDRILVSFSFIKIGRLAFEEAEAKEKFESELNYSLYHWRRLFVFIVPSLIGALLFVAPVKIGAAFTIPIAAIAVSMQALLSSSVTSIVTVVVTTTALMSIAVTLFKPKTILRIEFLRHLLDVSPIWLFTRSVGMGFALVTYFQVGPEAIRSEYTGSLVLNELMPVLFSVFILAGLLLPLLLNFGLFEFVGTLLTKVIRPLFGVPSLSAVNCVASWVGDGSVGILMTSKQYEEKFYTQKEAAIIGTTFSSVSIAFCLVVIGQVNLEHLFAPFYLTVCVAGVIAALILPRLPPLRFKKDEYFDGTKHDLDLESLPQDKTLFKYSIEVAFIKACQAPSVKGTLDEGIKNALNMVFAVLPVVMAIGTSALMVAEYTPLFQWLGQPFIPFLKLLQIPEAQEASKTIVVGFADMFIPSILAVNSNRKRFHSLCHCRHECHPTDLYVRGWIIANREYDSG